jgi:flagellar biosynthesis chaperone FliJ
VKRFRFPLERALDWRRVQSRIEEAKLEQLHAEARAIEMSRIETERAGIESARDLANRGATAIELAALASFQRFVTTEIARLDRARQDCAHRIEERMIAVTARHREVKLLEKLKTRQWEALRLQTNRAMDLEVEELAALKPKARAVDSL